MLKEVTAIYALLLIYYVPPCDGACPEGFVALAGRCVKYLANMKLFRDEAFTECSKLGANLPIVNNKAYIDGLYNYCKNNIADDCFSAHGFWTAARRLGTCDAFFWEFFRTPKFLSNACGFDTVANINNWFPGQPDNYKNNENCVQMGSHHDNMAFNDLPCYSLDSMKLCTVCETDEV